MQGSEPVWPSGKALVRPVSGLHWFDSPLRLSFIFNCRGLRTLSTDFAPHHGRDVKMSLIAAHLDAETIIVVTVLN